MEMEENSPAVAPENSVLANSKAELINWMSSGTKTDGWDAILAFDRATINNTFRQQYIQRFSTANLYPAINDIEPILGSTWEVTQGCVLSEPVLSFENAKITDSTAPAQLSLTVIGGSQLSVDYSVEETPKAVRINAFSAVSTPTLQMKNTLKIVQEPGYVGKIVVDLSEGTDYEFSSGDTAWEVDKLGNMFQRIFRESWSADQRTWVVNRIKSNAGPLAISGAYIRCQPAPGSTVRTAENYGDGAIIAFLRMTGSENGNFPNENTYKYLVPNDGPEYTASIIISHRRLLQSLGSNVFERASGWVDVAPTFKLKGDEEGSGLWLIFESGTCRRDTIRLPLSNGCGMEADPAYVWFLGVEKGANASLRLKKSDGSERMSMVFGIALAGVAERISIIKENVKVYTEEVTAIDVSEIWCNIRLNVEQQKIYVHGFNRFDGVAMVAPNNFHYPDVPVDELLGNLMATVTHSCMSILDGVSLRDTKMDLIPVTSMLFSGAYKTKLSEIAVPHDMIMFGHVAPEVNAFEITTPLPVIGQGSTHAFKLDTTQANISWKVENLPGETGNKGTIIEATGVYTAPVAANITGPQVRVKVTASKSGFSSSALVTVVKSPVNINPRVQYLNPGESCHLVAGALPGLAKSWGSVPATSGTLTDKNIPNRDRTFKAAERDEDKDLDIVRVTVSAGGGSVNAYVLVIHTPASIVVSAESSDYVAQQVQLTAKMGKNQVKPPYTWSILAGSGSINEAGLLVADAQPDEPFVVVGIEKLVDGDPYIGYMVFPVPFMPYPPKPDSASGMPSYVLGD
jgi:hypothetical protein